MVDRCAWLVAVGEVDELAQLTARQLTAYGVVVKGQRWPDKQPQAWMASAQEAAGDGARLVVVVATPESYRDPALRRQLALFRLFLQTLTRTTINGFVVLKGGTESSDIRSDLPGTAVLGDWESVGTENWIARAVARLHAPRRPKWPADLGLFAQEKLGVWLSVKPEPGQIIHGCMVGVSENQSDISFHAVGSAGQLPERSVNEYEMKGISFESAGHSFKAWALKNTLSANDAYFVRLEGEPDLLALATLPNGEIGDVDLINLR